MIIQFRFFIKWLMGSIHIPCLLIESMSVAIRMQSIHMKLVRIKVCQQDQFVSDIDVCIKSGTKFIGAFQIVQSMSFLISQHQIERDRKSTRLNSSHVAISYAVFCLKKKKTHNTVD